MLVRKSNVLPNGTVRLPFTQLGAVREILSIWKLVLAVPRAKEPLEAKVTEISHSPPPTGVTVPEEAFPVTVQIAVFELVQVTSVVGLSLVRLMVLVVALKLKAVTEDSEMFPALGMK